MGQGTLKGFTLVVAPGSFPSSATKYLPTIKVRKGKIPAKREQEAEDKRVGKEISEVASIKNDGKC